jgi:hypothetical protein
MKTNTPKTDEAATFRPNDDGMTDFVPADFARKLEREINACKEMVWHVALAQSTRCGITERLLLKIHEDMERISSANVQDDRRLPEEGVNRSVN